MHSAAWRTWLQESGCPTGSSSQTKACPPRTKTLSRKEHWHSGQQRCGQLLDLSALPRADNKAQGASESSHAMTCVRYKYSLTAGSHHASHCEAETIAHREIRGCWSIARHDRRPVVALQATHPDRRTEIEALDI